MPVSRSDLETAIQSTLSAPGASAAIQANGNRLEKLFEIYVLALLVRAVRRAGGSAQTWGIVSGPAPDPMVFRGAPGRLGSRGQDFAYVRCELNGTEFELHLGVEYEGSSGVPHELDVSMVDHSHAQKVRADPSRLPSTRHLRAGVECKCYSSSLGVHLGRTWVGLVADCGNLVLAGFATNGTSSQLAWYLSGKNRPEPFFDVNPTTGTNSDRLVAVFEQAIRKWCGAT